MFFHLFLECDKNEVVVREEKKFIFFIRKVQLSCVEFRYALQKFRKKRYSEFSHKVFTKV